MLGASTAAYRYLLLMLASIGVATAAHEQTNSTYASTCELCHQSAATGLRGQFPRLAGRVGPLAAEASGRDYLIHVVLFGMAGKITVDTVSLVGVMPSFASLSDADVAGVLNYLVHLKASGHDHVKAFSAAEVAAVRSGPQLSPGQVATLRASLVASGRMP
jgi:mono/diheme cytochrome c family protein